MKYDKTKTYIVKMNSPKKLMKKIEKVSSVLWAHCEKPTKHCPNKGSYCFYNGACRCSLTYSDEEYVLGSLFVFYNRDDVVELTENEFVEMLSELKPKRG
jgi:hypothetical protein